MDTAMCAFLRGVNVNGKNMKMEDVCNVFRQEAVQNVCSVLATGNILFKSTLTKAELRCNLEKRMSEYYKTDINLFIKTKEEIEIILKSVTFSAHTDLHVYVFICENGFERTLMDKFNSITPVANEKAQINNGQFYWQVSKGLTLDSGFSKILGTKQFKDRFTSRNINTIQKLFDRMI
jgi:uncharacterized protein (DUF1697 family)